MGQEVESIPSWSAAVMAEYHCCFCILSVAHLHDVWLPALSLSVPLPQFVSVSGVLLPATWGRHDHMLAFINGSVTAGPQPLLHLSVHILWVAASSPELPPPFYASPCFFFSVALPPSCNLVLRRSAVIKTDAGLKCQKRISNCQNINLFTLWCLFNPSGSEAKTE